MAKKNREISKRVNFFDGQKVTEDNLDTEQNYNNTIFSNHVVDFHGSGVVKENPFDSSVLLDTRSPGFYSSDGNNDSKFDIENGNYDGKGIYLDRQPIDTVRGSRIEFEITNANIEGRNKTKILVLGRAFNGIDSVGTLVAEFIEFEKNEKKVSQYFYLKIISVLLNNFSGATGKTEVSSPKDSLDLISENLGFLVIREAAPLSVYAASRVSYQVESPNFDLLNFITSSTSNDIYDEISAALGDTESITDLYLEPEGKESLRFEKDASTAIAYGQKFLSKTNNLQRIDLLLSVEEDNTQTAGNEFDFSGDIVVAIYKLTTDTDCPTDAVPDRLIDFDPDITPLAEISFSQDDFELLGYQLNDEPKVVSFNFSGTIIADPNIDPSLEVDKFYAFLIYRSGDNRTGTILLEKGYDKVFYKSENNLELTTLEKFGKQNTKFVEFDPNTKKFINDSESSLWHAIYSDTIEITDGTAYSSDGKAIVLSKTEEFVGGSEISFFMNSVPLRTVSENAENYVILSQIQKFTDPGTHPRTNEFVFTKIIDSPSVSVVSREELDTILEDQFPIILAKIEDSNVRDSESITGTFEKPGLVLADEVIIVDPGNDFLLSNLVNRVIVPDTNCNCNAKYRIVKVDCEKLIAGDLNSDNSLSSADIASMLSLVGLTINSESTERKILTGDVAIEDFLKSDLNNDGTIDGSDIALLEAAVDGYVNFVVEEEIKILRLKLETILDTDSSPVIFTDVALTGSTEVGTSNLTFSVVDYRDALIMRVGDIVTIDSISTDAGTYIIESKVVSDDNLTVELSVTSEESSTISFLGDSGFNIIVTSRTKTNLMVDNKNLINIPFESVNYEINFIEAPFSESFVDICDLRRFVGTSFVEEKTLDCECETSDCLPENDCGPELKNQQYFSGDIYLPDGEILSAPGIPYHGDFEYVNITMPIPAGSITDCAIDLYNTFIKSEDSSCFTSAGYPAMKYSDGTYVGCEDDSSSNDISKNKVKFSNAIASIYVDAVVDGYSDGYSSDTTEDSNENIENIQESFVDYSYTSFDLWSENGLNSPVVTITHNAGTNEAAVFDLLTTADSVEKFGRLDGPDTISDDFLIDFSSARVIWPESSLNSGSVSSFSTIEISNLDGSSSTLKLGWKVIGGSSTKMFYSGIIRDTSSVVISTFNYEIDSPDSIGERVFFRLRRIDDVVTAMYILPNNFSATTAENFGQYIRIGENPEFQPGSGTAQMSFEISQINSPDAGLNFFTRLTEVNIFSDYSSDSDPAFITVGRDSSTLESDRFTLTFPINLTRRTSIISSVLSLTSKTSGTILDTYNVIPLNILNANNLGVFYNYPIETDSSHYSSFVPGTLIIGRDVEVDITTMVSSFLVTGGHLPGFIKGIIIEADITANSSMDFEKVATFTITYEDQSTGVIFKIGVSLNHATGIATFNTRNVLYDSLVTENRTVINFGVYLKKSGFINRNLDIGINELDKFGIGSCSDPEELEDDECFFIVGATATGTFVEGPFPCSFHLP